MKKVRPRDRRDEETLLRRSPHQILFHETRKRFSDHTHTHSVPSTQLRESELLARNESTGEDIAAEQDQGLLVACSRRAGHLSTLTPALLAYPFIFDYAESFEIVYVVCGWLIPQSTGFRG